METTLYWANSHVFDPLQIKLLIYLLFRQHSPGSSVECMRRPKLQFGSTQMGKVRLLGQTLNIILILSKPNSV